MEWISGNIFIRPNGPMAIGDVIDGHKHNFDHTTIFHLGSFHIRAKLPDGTILERDFVAPAHALIRADVEHEITALEDGSVFWCVYSHRTPQGDVSVANTGWQAAYY